MYMLDTNAVIMAIRHPDWKVLPRIEQHIGGGVCISVITLGEMEYGARKSDDPEMTRLGLYQFLAGIPVMDFDSKAAQHFGDIYGDLDMRHMQIGDRDSLIAAHARSLGCTLVTNNTREFSRVKGLKIEDWSK